MIDFVSLAEFDLYKDKVYDKLFYLKKKRNLSDKVLPLNIFPSLNVLLETFK